MHLNLAAAFSDTVLVVHGGEIHAAGTPAEVLTAQTLREVFGVEVRIYDHGGTPHIVMVDMESGQGGRAVPDAALPAASHDN